MTLKSTASVTRCRCNFPPPYVPAQHCATSTYARNEDVSHQSSADNHFSQDHSTLLHAFVVAPSVVSASPRRCEEASEGPCSSVGATAPRRDVHAAVVNKSAVVVVMRGGGALCCHLVHCQQLDRHRLTCSTACRRPHHQVWSGQRIWPVVSLRWRRGGRCGC
ncbi:hypothetical protein JIQ42_05468 [Leishmania sp. Namibia]|uniref:hypothetical protein n=1 Tax=Leishmania sp. Namibia TaxID=2802991 RepID=UPI001B554833|nr:hypothetical protein JIQ42_05468 [Leishmania sp. Namibia]